MVVVVYITNPRVDLFNLYSISCISLWLLTAILIIRNPIPSSKEDPLYCLFKEFDVYGQRSEIYYLYRNYLFIN